MKTFLLESLGWIVVCHCWISGALCAGIAADYWFGAPRVVAGIVIGVSLFLMPLILLIVLEADKKREA